MLQIFFNPKDMSGVYIKFCSAIFFAVLYISSQFGEKMHTFYQLGEKYVLPTQNHTNWTFKFKLIKAHN